MVVESTRMPFDRTLYVIIACLAAPCGAALAVEPWADPALPVSAGLELWLDASRLASAAAAPVSPGGEAMAAPASGGRVAAWYDASGKRRHALQPAEPYQPIFRDDLIEGQAAPAVLRFDGINDHLSISGLHLEVADFTLFVAGAPHSNPGGYRAFLAFSQAGRNDYTHGLNLDLGGRGTSRFERLNLESKGAGGEQDLLQGAYPFGSFHVLGLSSSAGGDGGVRLHAGGQPRGGRARVAGSLRLDEARIGARSYSNTEIPPFTQGFFHGDLAEVLFYSRLLEDGERQAVEKYLAAKYGAYLEASTLGVGLPVQALAPGFSVRELPAALTNVNDLLYLPDGRLAALGYDGRIHALRDADGDGLEDTVEPLWTGPPLTIPIAMARAPEGLYVTSHARVSLLRDLDGDGRLEREDIVASGWVPADTFSGGGVDAMGLVLDAAGNLFFGIGCADFTNAYRLREGKARYDIGSERGTILKLSPDRRQREIFATGIRFPYVLRFNRAGDLFATDQEGETWLPNGNPLDELDHIVQGRHYGFPPRHEEHLPGVRDEPPVVGFSPQHQSTCGLVFNEAAPGGKLFGPAAWEGDAFVAGYSRGKIWRARLAKTPAGYIGRAAVFGTAQVLALTLALSPAGDLVLATHSGAPDWGSGPGGPGRLFKFAHSDPEAPQPAAIWPAGPLEVRVAFDRPLPAASLEAIARGAIAYGEHARAGDRHELHRPGYASVEMQEKAPRGSLRIAEARLSASGRTVVLSVDPHPMRATYVVSLGGGGRSGTGTGTGTGTNPEVSYDLSGVAASWQGEAADGPAAWAGWLPHLDVQAAAAFTRGSEEHEALRARLGSRGRLRLATRLVLPALEVGLELEANAPFAVALAGREESSRRDGGVERASLRVASAADPVSLRIDLETGGAPPAFHVSWSPALDPTPRPLPVERLLLPWAPDRLPPPPGAGAPPPELAGGDADRGREVFFSKEARCAACHRLRGEGEAIGPDLSNLVHRDRASVARDILEPSAAIHPDYLPSAVLLRNGEVLAGLVRAAAAGEVRIVDGNAVSRVVASGDILELRPSPVSIMPGGFLDVLGAGKLRDVLAFLCGPGPAGDSAPAGPVARAGPAAVAPAPDENAGAPAAPARAAKDVDALLGAVPDPPAESKPRTINIVLVAGPKDHGPGEHDYPRWQERWKDLLRRDPSLRVSAAWEWPDRTGWDLADLVVFYFWNHDWSEARYRDLDAYLARGGGLVFIHSAVIPEREPEKLAARIGLAWEPGRTKFRHGALDLEAAARGAPAAGAAGAAGAGAAEITRGLERTHFVDETYWPLIGDPKRVEVLATAVEDDAARPMVWTFTPAKGRVFCSIPGHYAATFDDPFFRVLLLRGMAWAAGEPTGRLQRLAIADPGRR